jgi:hypothetical protein
MKDGRHSPRGPTATHDAANHPTPIKIAGHNSIMNSPFLHQKETEPVYGFHHSVMKENGHYHVYKEKEERRITPCVYPKHYQELIDRPEDWLDGIDHYHYHSSDRCDHYPRGRMYSHPATPKKESRSKETPWVHPEHHQELTGRPEEYLGGGYGDSEREMANHYARNRPPPIQIAGNTSIIKSSPFLHSKSTEPVYGFHPSNVKEDRHTPRGPMEQEEEEEKEEEKEEEEEKERITPWVYPKHHQELIDRPEDWLDGTDRYSLDRCDHYPRGRMYSHPAAPKKESHSKETPWVYPKHHQELTGRPEEYLGGGYGDSEREMANHYARNRPPPIQITGNTSIKSSPFLHSKSTEPIYGFVSAHPGLYHFMKSSKP